MRRHIPVTTERLGEIGNTASNIIQKTVEAAGTLKMIDEVLSESEKTFDNNIIWALRNAIRNIESATANATDITDKIETFEEIK